MVGHDRSSSVGHFHAKDGGLEGVLEPGKMDGIDASDGMEFVTFDEAIDAHFDS